MRNFAILMVWVSLVSMRGSLGEQCGKQGDEALCPNNLCCSAYGWCGCTSAYCCEGCQSQCNCTICPPPLPASPPRPRPPSPPPRSDLASLISEELFDELLAYRNDPRCPAAGFCTYQSFIDAAAYYPEFAGVGGDETRKREIAAFLGQTSHETTGKLPEAPYASGYCFKEEIGCPGTYCVPDVENPCVDGKKYCGRGPIQISHNYNYGPAGRAIGYDLIADPDAVATDPVISFATAFWFWMTPRAPKPSCHEVIIGAWTPSAADVAANRLPGYGVITNIINGGLECGHGEDDRVKDRIGFYERYCGIFGVGSGDNIDCYDQRPFGNSILPHIAMKLDRSS